ncbi:gamma-glutamyltransferase [Candidatus Synechococcus calcipolaris G9]|uniref:Glutathione hydrolase proenzyme n=1 Tax=Candidatus Synechococcus calcipolaris G9 TaxID=1497997 RepID=A0ABT6F1P1_9SYNE|nr:gamma-glutamyltransferase [Candidatus Synechococcus calcipolaris]MDG2991759.1 gamma-glutamyltransferase [Candidatus Synechococcus calcipolaris G9]
MNQLTGENVTHKFMAANLFRGRVYSFGLGIALGVQCFSFLPVPAIARPPQLEPTETEEVMVAASHPLATAAGVKILAQGGNAIDGAIATALAISVVQPYSAGLGGGGFALVFLNQEQQVRALDFRERAPLGAGPDMYLDDHGEVMPRASLDGYRAVATPGTIAGLAELHRQYGELPWADLVQPALDYAQQGFIINETFHRMLQWRWPALRANPEAAALLSYQGRPLTVGDRFQQPDLAKTLGAIAANPQVFYQGWIGEALVTDMAQHQGLITLRDLQEYRPVWRSPLCGTFLELEVCSMPPPSSGGVALIQMLNLLAKLDIQQNLQYQSASDRGHALAAVMQIAYGDRAVYLGDSDFVPVPVTVLTSLDYAAERVKEIPRRQSRSQAQVRPASPQLIQSLEQRQESTNTSHLTVVDRHRNAVSLTFTLNGPFGSGVVVPGTGIFLNNEMDDFAAAADSPNLFGLVGTTPSAAQPLANAIAPGKRPLSSMSPTIVREKGELRYALGSPGGSRIISTVLQILLSLELDQANALEAVTAPRIHHQWQPDTLFVESDISQAQIQDWSKWGYSLQEQGRWGNANVIRVLPDGRLQGATDPRGNGAAAGF